MLAVAIEIEGEKLRTIKNEELINAMLENAMKNEKFRQFQDHQRIPQDLT